jgi:hypothetical protein
MLHIRLGVAKTTKKINPRPHKKVCSSASLDKTPYIVRSLYDSVGGSGLFLPDPDPTSEKTGSIST